MVELGQELSRIYLTLSNATRLSVTQVETRERTIEAALRSKRLYFGKGFSSELDSLACDLNSKICTRERISTSSEQTKVSNGHVSGLLPSPTNWTFAPEVTQLWVPDVTLTADYEWFALEVTGKSSVKSLVVDELGGCEDFDEQCRKLITFYNQALGPRIFDPGFKGRLSLPVPPRRKRKREGRRPKR